MTSKSRVVLGLTFLVLPIIAWKLYSIPILIALVLAFVFIKNTNIFVIISGVIASLAIHTIAVNTGSSVPLAGYWGYSIVYGIIAYFVGID
jgi:hypothetical protein